MTDRPSVQPLATILAVLFLAQGCAIRTGTTIAGKGDLRATPPGRAAVLKVTAYAENNSKSGHVTWGVLDTPNPDQRFAELLAYVAATEGGLSVIEPMQVIERLEDAGLEPTFQPDDATLARYAEVLGCSSVLTADIKCWRHKYVFFSSSATVEFTLTCRVPGKPDALWGVRTCCSRRKMDNTEIALHALKETFRALKARHDREGWCECPE